MRTRSLSKALSITSGVWETGRVTDYDRSVTLCGNTVASVGRGNGQDVVQVRVQAEGEGAEEVTVVGKELRAAIRHMKGEVIVRPDGCVSDGTITEWVKTVPSYRILKDEAEGLPERFTISASHLEAISGMFTNDSWHLAMMGIYASPRCVIGTDSYRAHWIGDIQPFDKEDWLYIPPVIARVVPKGKFTLRKNDNTAALVADGISITWLSHRPHIPNFGMLSAESDCVDIGVSQDIINQLTLICNSLPKTEKVCGIRESDSLRLELYNRETSFTIQAPHTKWATCAYNLGWLLDAFNFTSGGRWQVPCAPLKQCVITNGNRRAAVMPVDFARWEKEQCL